MKYTVLIRKDDGLIQLVMPGEVDTAQFDSHTFDTELIDADEDNLIDALTDLDSSWLARFDLRITPKPSR